MNSPMDKFYFGQANNVQSQNPDISDIINRARQNPRAFEEHIRKTNPQAYQRAIQIRNSVANPQQVIMQMAQQRGINPNILRMLDI